MRNSHWTVIVVVLVSVTVVPSAAQTARSLAMGNAAVGVADDSVAWSQNPAGLPHLRVPEMSVSPWPGHVSGTIDLGADADTMGLNYSARSSEGGRGWGVGYWQFEAGSSETETIGGGYGAKFSRPGLTWGVALKRTDISNAVSTDEIVADVGFMFRRVLPASKLKVGLVARDITGQIQNTFDVGASLQLPTGLLVAADIADITDEMSIALNAGAEWRPPGFQNWTVRAGLADGDLTYGLGYRLGMLNLGISRQHLGVDDVTSATVSTAF